jgi:hypothetical protein
LWQQLHLNGCGISSHLAVRRSVVAGQLASIWQQCHVIYTGWVQFIHKVLDCTAAFERQLLPLHCGNAMAAAHAGSTGAYELHLWV